MKTRLLLLACLISSCSCGSKEPTPPPVPAPVEAPAKPAVATDTPPAVSKPDTAAPGTVPLVDTQKLRAQIPAQVGDWKRIELLHFVQETGDGNVLQVNGAYQIDDKSPVIYILIADTRGFKSLAMAFREMHDRPTAGITPFEQAGEPSFEQFLARPLFTSYMTLVDDRYLITVSGEGSDQPTVRKFLDALDIPAIAALK